MRCCSGAIGGPKWSAPQAKVRPEQGLLRLRKELGVYANLRPVSVHPALRDASTLKAEVLEGVDLMFVRELTGGIYFGAKTRDAQQQPATCAPTPAPRSSASCASPRALARTRRAQAHFDRQGQRARDLAPVARGDASASCAANSPDVQLEHMLVDSAAMHLIRRPRDFDVAVTENMFGDILTDEASMLAGSLGPAAVGLARRRHARPV